MEELETPSHALPLAMAFFTSLHFLLAVLPAPFGFRHPSFLLLPFEGVVLGPAAGALAAMLGASAGYLMSGEADWLPVLVFSEAVGAAAAGLLFQRRWKALTGLLALMLGAYLAHPHAWHMPIACLLLPLLAIACLPIAIALSSPPFLARGRELLASLLNALPEAFHGRERLGLPIAMAAAAFYALSTDLIARAFMLVPLAFHAILGLGSLELLSWWQLACSATRLELLVAVLASSICGPVALSSLRHKGFECPLASGRGS